jgi:uncharacterized membrane protein YuzA (DUF378 family)
MILLCAFRSSAVQIAFAIIGTAAIFLPRIFLPL